MYVNTVKQARCDRPQLEQIFDNLKARAWLTNKRETNVFTTLFCRVSYEPWLLENAAFAVACSLYIGAVFR